MTEYIDRGKLITDIKNRYCKPCEDEKRDYNHVRCRACWVEDMIDEIDEAPTADVQEVKHGKWEWYEEKCGNPIDGQDREWGWRCSACKDTLNDEYDDPDRPPRFSFCHSCGSDMIGGKNE